MELPGESDSARNNARCTQARKITQGLDGQHQDVDRTPRGRVSQNERTEIMEKVRPWCGQPSDRGRLKNRTKQYDTINRGRISTSAVTPPSTEERSIVLSVSVCVCVLSVRDHISETTHPIIANFFYACYPWSWLGPPLAA